MSLPGSTDGAQVWMCGRGSGAGDRESIRLRRSSVTTCGEDPFVSRARRDGRADPRIEPRDSWTHGSGGARGDRPRRRAARDGRCRPGHACAGCAAGTGKSFAAGASATRLQEPVRVRAAQPSSETRAIACVTGSAARPASSDSHERGALADRRRHHEWRGWTSRADRDHHRPRRRFLYGARWRQRDDPLSRGCRLGRQRAAPRQRDRRTGQPDHPLTTTP